MGPSETESLLKSKKLRKTPLRIRVLEQFLSKAHSAIQIGKLEEDLGGVDRITLYRITSIMCSCLFFIHVFNFFYSFFHHIFLL